MHVGVVSWRWKQRCVVLFATLSIVKSQQKNNTLLRRLLPPYSWTRIVLQDTGIDLDELFSGFGADWDGSSDEEDGGGFSDDDTGEWGVPKPWTGRQSKPAAPVVRADLPRGLLLCWLAACLADACALHPPAISMALPNHRPSSLQRLTARQHLSFLLTSRFFWFAILREQFWRSGQITTVAKSTGALARPFVEAPVVREEAPPGEGGGGGVHGVWRH
jgi:hypothetical protein